MAANFEREGHELYAYFREIRDRIKAQLSETAFDAAWEQGKGGRFKKPSRTLEKTP